MFGTFVRMIDPNAQLLKPIKESLDALRNSIDKQTEAIRRYYEADQSPRRSKWSKLKTGLEYIGVATAVVLAVLTYLTFRRISSQAESAREQVRIMQAQLATTDRAWIKVAAANLIGDVEFQNDRFVQRQTDVSISVGLSAQNVGRSVALNAKVFGHVILQSGVVAEELTQFNACNANAWDAGVQLIPDYVGPFSVFPSESRQFKIFWEGKVDTKDRGKSIDPQLIGCVIYFLPKSQQPHYSAFAYTIQNRPADPAAPWNKPLIKIGDNVKKADLIAWPHPGTGTFANAN